MHPSLSVSFFLIVAAGDWDVVPSATVMGLYDNNLFGTPTDKTAVVSSRFGPRLSVAYRSTRVRFSGAYALDAALMHDGFGAEPLLAQQFAGLRAGGHAAPRLELRSGFTFTDTSSPMERLLTVNLDRGRRIRTTVFELGANYALTQRSTAQVGYLTQTQTQSQTSGTLHQGSVELRHRVGARDTTGIAVVQRQFLFDPGTRPWSTTVLISWERALERWLELDVRGGPRRQPHRWDAEAAAALRFRRPTAHGQVEYARTESLVAGNPTVLRTNRIGVSLNRKLWNDVWVISSPAAWIGHSKHLDVLAVALESGPRWTVTPWLTAFATAQIALQRIDEPSGRRRIRHDRFMAGVQLTQAEQTP